MDTNSATLVCVLSYFVTSTYAQFLETCDLNPSCKDLPTLNLTLKQYVDYSPFYEHVNQYIEDTKETVGACVTFFPVANSTYMVFRNVRLKCGGTNLELYLSTGIDGKFGTFRLEGLFNTNLGNTTSVLNAYLVGSGCESCSLFFMFYACYLLDTESYVHPVDKIVYSAYTSPDPPSSCLDQYELLVDQLGFTHSAGFARASGPLPPCVTRFNNNTCVNADKVDPANAISIP